MSGGRPFRPGELRIVAALTLLAWAATLLPLPNWLQAATALPLVLVLPGYAIASALFPSHELPREELVVYAITFSVAAAAIGGVLAQLVVPLDETTWPLLLAGIALAATTVAARRRQSRYYAERQPAAPQSPIGVLASALLVAALGVAAWSVVLATDGARQQAAEARFTSLWIAPDRGPVGGVAVGVENEEGEAAEYLVVLRAGDEELARWTVRLADSRSWTTEVPRTVLPEGAQAVAELYRDGRLRRRVYLRPGAPA